ncbi:MAG: phosphotransferase [Planctomycetaceae bacterium]|nr:phosphotransferase [Planctomycetaceae bacterium]
MPLSSSQLSPILASYGLVAQPAEPQPCQVYRGFSGAEVYRVETNRGPVALRKWPQESPPRERILSLHRLLRHLHKVGLKTIAVPFSTEQGADQTLVHFRGSTWQCEQWLPGEPLLNTQVTPERIRTTMHALADWHLAASQFQPDLVAHRWFRQTAQAAVPALKERLNLIHLWTPERISHTLRRTQPAINPWQKWVHEYLEYFVRCSNPISLELSEAMTWQVPLQPCLRDVWHDHILLENDQVTGIIDPSATRTENVSIDLARLLGSFLSLDDPLWGIALHAYQQKRSLNTAEIRLVEILYRSSTLLSGLSWIERLTGSEPDLYHDSRVCNRLEYLLTSLKYLPKHMK